MNQLDLFQKNSDDFLYEKIQKIRNSMERRCRAMFAIITELQDQFLKMQEKGEKKMKKLCEECIQFFHVFVPKNGRFTKRRRAAASSFLSVD